MRVLSLTLYLLTVILLLVGAQLQVLKSALQCPDWPLCFGEFLPLYSTPAFYESLHRFLASFVAMGSLAWAIMRFSEIKMKALLPLFLILLQSLLGWATFYYKLPTITTILHLIFALLFLAALEGTSPLKIDFKLKENWNPKLKDVVGFFLFFIVMQMILGGILRKSSLLASCESTMEFWPCWQKQAEIPLAGSLSLFHRFMGLGVTFVGFFVFSYLIKHLPRWKKIAIFGLVLCVAQVVLGLQMGRSSSRELIFYHFTIALALFCLLLFLLVRLRKMEFSFFGGAVPTYLNDVMDLFKPKLTILVVVTLLVGVMLTNLDINIIYLIFSLIAIWFQAAGSLALNCYLEREIDKHMERTKNRPLPAGRLKPEVALYWGWGLIALGTIILIFCSNLLTAMLGLFSAISYLYIYTPLKLKTPYALYVGAIPGAIPTLMGWTVVTNTLLGMGAYLFGLLFLWQIPHFMAISIYRGDEYKKAQLITFTQTHSQAFLKFNIFIYSLMLAFYGVLPFVWQWRGEGYLICSVLIGLSLFIWSCIGLGNKSEEQFKIWARTYFIITLFYLPLQLIVLLVLR